MLIFNVIGDNPQKPKSIEVNETLITRIGQDDKVAFRELYETTNQSLYAYILSLVRDPNEAQDILQETYLKIRSAAHLYTPQGKPMAWIFTIARNLANMHFRYSNRIIEDPIDEITSNELEARGVDRQDIIVLRTLLDGLDEEERSIILLHMVSGYKHYEIARDLDKPLSTVLSRYNRGIKKLRRLVEQQMIA
ncbi:MAG: RNA polymerase sigma factor [Anaerolineaceae bacterium]|jgi:RNA polymerase sigma-70 factor (ECF subfamily)